MIMPAKENRNPDALVLISPHCPHCALVLQGLQELVKEMPGVPTYGYTGFLAWDTTYWNNWPGSENPYTQPYPHWGPYKYQTPFLTPTGA